MAIINSPPQTPCDTQDANGNLMPPSEGWRGFFHAAWTICNSLTESGTTAQRPTAVLWAGRRYFDISLGTDGEPIWRNRDNTGWVGLSGGGTGGTVTNINTTSPIMGGPILLTGTISILDAAADGATKGAAAFVPNDFNASAGVVSIDYVNAQKATASQPGFLTAADWVTFNAGGGGSGTVTNITTTAPLTGGPITTTGAIGITDAAADGATKGAAAFIAADFNATAGLISIDYTNAQKATAGQPGFLTAADWTTFNSKGAGTVTSASVTIALDDTTTESGSPITASGTSTLTGVDAGVDALVGWDDSAGKKVYFTLGTNLSTTGTVLNASGGGGAADSITGTTGATGGPATVTGGTSTTSANIGGTAVIVGGTPGATGVGGPVTVTGGAGGATSGTGGAVTLRGGLPVDGVGGAVALIGGTGVGATTKLGGDVTLTGGVGSATTSGGAGGAVRLSGGAGGVGTAGGTGGAIVLLAGTGAAGSGIGGAINITGGTSAGAGAGGALLLNGGTSPSGVGGAVTLTSGVGTTNNAGTTSLLGAASSAGVGGPVVITAGASGGFNGAPAVTITAGTGGSSGVAGGIATLKGGPAGGTGNGGAANVTGGIGGGTGTGGAVNVTGGVPGATGNAGAVNITGGTPAAGAGGAINITASAGVGTDKAGGNVVVRPGAATGTGNPGNIQLDGGRGAALATTAIGGFVTIPTCAGTPTATPVNVPTGSVALVFDTTGNKLWIFDSAWIGVVLA